MVKAVALGVLICLMLLQERTLAKGPKGKHHSKAQIENNMTEVNNQVDGNPKDIVNKPDNSDSEVTVQENRLGNVITDTKGAMDRGIDEQLDGTTTETSNTNEEGVPIDVTTTDIRSSDETFFLFRWTGLLFFICAVLLIGGIFLLILLSVYYRLYMFKKKSAPFEAPRILQMFFPKPMNYEHEITILCSKYMNN